jgi:hypothetical protein
MLHGFIWFLSEVHLIVVTRTMNQCKYQVNSKESRLPNIMNEFECEPYLPIDDKTTGVCKASILFYMNARHALFQFEFSSLPSTFVSLLDLKDSTLDVLASLLCFAHCAKGRAGAGPISTLSILTGSSF